MDESKVVLPDPDDRHVVATAVGCAPARIVTQNLRDFPAAALPADVEAEDADAFLQRLLGRRRDSVLACIEEQAATTGRHGKPHLSVPYVLRSLELAGATRFAATIRHLVGQM